MSGNNNTIHALITYCTFLWVTCPRNENDYNLEYNKLAHCSALKSMLKHIQR